MGSLLASQRAATPDAAGGHALAAADRDALEAAFRSLLDAWSAGDALSYAALFTHDATYVGFDGRAFRAPAEIAASHEELFRGVLRGSRLTGTIEEIRAVGRDGAVMLCRGAVVTRGRTTPGRGRESVQTLVAVRTGAGWRFTAFQNTRYRPLPRFVQWYMRRAAARARRP